MLAEALTEPSAVAPDAGVYFSDNFMHKRVFITEGAFTIGATALGSVISRFTEFKLTHYRKLGRGVTGQGRGA